jgi:hypothetical protein
VCKAAPIADATCACSYFEANGHGTVLFHPSLLERLREMEDSSTLSVRLGAPLPICARGMPDSALPPPLRSCVSFAKISRSGIVPQVAWSGSFAHAAEAWCVRVVEASCDCAVEPSCVRAVPFLVRCQAEGRVALARILAASRLINQVRCA